MDKIGFALPHVEKSHLAYQVISNINKIVLEKNDIAPSIFAHELTRCCIQASCPIFNMADIWGYDGTVVATDFVTAQALLNSPGPKKKIFYVWDLEWLRMTNQYILFRDLYNIFNDNKLTIVPRCDNHRLVLMNNFGTETTDPISDANIEKLLLC